MKGYRSEGLCGHVAAHVLGSGGCLAISSGEANCLERARTVRDEEIVRGGVSRFEFELCRLDLIAEDFSIVVLARPVRPIGAIGGAFVQKSDGVVVLMDAYGCLFTGNECVFLNRKSGKGDLFQIFELHSDKALIERIVRDPQTAFAQRGVTEVDTDFGLIKNALLDFDVTHGGSEFQTRAHRSPKPAAEENDIRRCVLLGFGACELYGNAGGRRCLKGHVGQNNLFIVKGAGGITQDSGLGVAAD